MVWSKRIKRRGRYYVYYFDEHGKLLTYTKWSSDKHKREHFNQLAKKRISERQFKIGYIVTGYHTITGTEEGREGSIFTLTVRWGGKAKIKMEDGELITWDYIEDITLKERFAQILFEVLKRIGEMIGYEWRRTSTNYDVSADWDKITGELEIGNRLYMVEAVQKGDWIVITTENLGNYKRNMLLKACKKEGIKVLLWRKKK